MKNTDFIRILHFSDTHLFKDPKQALCGQNTDSSLEAVLKDAQNLPVKADFVLATGDLSQDMTPESYQRFRGKFSRLGLPVHCLPGNHDDPAVMSALLKEAPVQVSREVIAGNWQVIMLSSVLPKSNDGYLSESELAFLDACLAKRASPHVLISMHHSPIQIDSRWLDSMAIRNAPEFFALVDRYPQVKALVWGHIHQEYEGKRKDIKMLATPSTCVQFKPRQENFAFDGKPPGYRWIELYKNGRIETGIRRVEAYRPTVDLTAPGY